MDSAGQGIVDKAIYNAVYDDLMKAEAENKRLRWALRTIEDKTRATPDDRDGDFMELCDRVNEIAQAALKGEK